MHQHTCHLQEMFGDHLLIGHQKKSAWCKQVVGGKRVLGHRKLGSNQQTIIKPKPCHVKIRRYIGSKGIIFGILHEVFSGQEMLGLWCHKTTPSDYSIFDSLWWGSLARSESGYWQRPLRTDIVGISVNSHEKPNCHFVDFDQASVQELSNGLRENGAE